MLIDHSEFCKLDLGAKDSSGYTGFHFACHFGNTYIVEMLLDVSESLNLDLTAKTDRGSTGYQLAVIMKKFDVIDAIEYRMPSLIV